MNTIRAAAVQFEHVSGDKHRNFGKIDALARLAAARGARIIAFPECCITGYWFLRKLSRGQLLDLAEEIPAGESTQRLLALSKGLDVTIGAGLIEREGDAMFNTYVVATPDGKHHRHRKIQAFESEHIHAGKEYTVFDTPDGVRVGVLICYDNNIIENARINAILGAQVLLAPHQTGGCNSLSPHGMKPIDPALWHNREQNPSAMRDQILGPNGKGWLMRWLPSRAHDNGMFILFANGVGIDDDEVRTGNSMILDPYGRTIASFDEAGDGMAVGDLDLSLIEQSTGRRWIKARRPDLYWALAMSTGKEQDTRAVRFGAK